MSVIEGLIQNWNNILKKAKKTDEVVVFGVNKGTDVQSFLEENGILISLYFDNSGVYVGTYINGVKVQRPYKIQNEETLYIICAASEKNRKEMSNQLASLGIVKDNIALIPVYSTDIKVIDALSDEEMLEEISTIYSANTGRIPDLSNPQLYTEIVNAKKMGMAKELYTRVADKYLVKKYIAEKLGNQYVVPLIGVWDKPEDINFDFLPQKFVLKMNNASGRNIIVKNKSELDFEKTKEQLDTWLKDNYGYRGFSLQYRDITPKIICEEYLEGLAENVYDYQFFCFHGEPKYIWCIKGSHRMGCRASFYDMDWNIQPFSFGYPRDDEIAPKPTRLGEMIEISRKLSADFEHVRVDLYEMPDGRLLFGELTFQTWGGFRRFYPSQYDSVFGDFFNK